MSRRKRGSRARARLPNPYQLGKIAETVARLVHAVASLEKTIREEHRRIAQERREATRGADEKDKPPPRLERFGRFKQLPLFSEGGAE